MYKLSKVLQAVAALALLASLAATYQPAAAGAGAAVAATSSNDAQIVPGQVVVGFSAAAPKVQAARASALAQGVGAQVTSQNGSLALLAFDPGADVMALAAQLRGQPGVQFAEPNYMFQVSLPAVSSAGAAAAPSRVAGLRAPVAAADAPRPGYPNDPLLWTNWGWHALNADIVWPNATTSAGICQLDSGVDYNHLDLKANVVKGYDFVNSDPDPMDDYGQGTAYAGVMVAKMNNAEGLAGISNGKLVAVKVLSGQGYGITYNIAAGINYCATRTDVKILNIGYTLPDSLAIKNALANAIGTNGKLVMVAAGDYNSSSASFPASLIGTKGSGYDFTTGLLAVGSAYNYGCRKSDSDYGAWVSVVAPGDTIMTTMPWDRPFYLNYFRNFQFRYDNVGGTGIASAFASAAAARRWGYKPTATNAMITNDMLNIGGGLYTDGSCWPASMSTSHWVDVARLLERGAAYADIRSNTNASPLTGAQLLVYQSGVLKGSSLVYGLSSSRVEVLNLPAGHGYTAMVNLAGVTAGPQPAFQQTTGDGSHDTIAPGWWTYFGNSTIPNKSTNFDVVSGWQQSNNSWGGDYTDDLYVFLPATPNPADTSQPGPFIVGNNSGGNSYGALEGNAWGSLNSFPFAIFNHYYGWWPDTQKMGSTTISSRLSHGSLAANPALPYYPGTYTIAMSDHGNTIADDGKHVLYHTVPFVYIWKDGMVKAFLENGNCNTSWWQAFQVTSGPSGAATIAPLNECSDTGTYMFAPIPGH